MLRWHSAEYGKRCIMGLIGASCATVEVDNDVIGRGPVGSLTREQFAASQTVFLRCSFQCLSNAESTIPHVDYPLRLSTQIREKNLNSEPQVL